MKKIKYQLLCKQVKTIFDAEGILSIVQEDALSDVETDYTTEAEYERIKAIAYNGEVTIEDDGQDDTAEPTTEERIAELEEALELLLSGVTE